MSSSQSSSHVAVTTSKSVKFDHKPTLSPEQIQAAQQVGPELNTCSSPIYAPSRKTTRAASAVATNMPVIPQIPQISIDSSFGRQPAASTHLYVSTHQQRLASLQPFYEPRSSVYQQPLPPPVHHDVIQHFDESRNVLWPQLKRPRNFTNSRRTSNANNATLTSDKFYDEEKVTVL